MYSSGVTGGTCAYSRTVYHYGGRGRVCVCVCVRGARNPTRPKKTRPGTGQATASNGKTAKKPKTVKEAKSSKDAVVAVAQAKAAGTSAGERERVGRHSGWGGGTCSPKAWQIM